MTRVGSASPARSGAHSHPVGGVAGPRSPWQILEGESKAFTGVIEFPTAEAAYSWYTSPAYQEIVPLRVRNTKSRIVIFEGTPTT